MSSFSTPSFTSRFGRPHFVVVFPVHDIVKLRDHVIFKKVPIYRNFRNWFDTSPPLVKWEKYGTKKVFIDPKVTEREEDAPLSPLIFFSIDGPLGGSSLFSVQSPPSLLKIYLVVRPLSSRCSFSMMVKWANDGKMLVNDGEMLVNDGEMLVNDGEMSMIIHTFHHHWLAFHHH